MRMENRPKIVIENENAAAVGVEGTSTETMLNDAVEAAGQVKNILHAAR